MGFLLPPTCKKLAYHVFVLESFPQTLFSHKDFLTQPMDPEKKSLNFIFRTKYVIPKSLSRLAIGQVSFSRKNRAA